MNYYSTNRQSPIVDFKEATISGQAPDRGLYFPDIIPQIDKGLLDNLSKYPNEEIAFNIIRPFVGTTIPADELFRIVIETVNFPIPLVKVNDRISSLELFHGPTLAFKDIGARFMSRCLGYFMKDKKEKVTVLVATSGDTGGAVANGFYAVEGIEVVILYPSGKVSPVQEKQLTTLSKNIHALEIQGTFDDCQQMVKKAFTDESIKAKRFLTSANSINVARWLPQQFYYAFALKQWKEQSAPVISVPSGNFGNICAGILAMKSGLPVDHFIAACNVNNIVTDYLHTQELKPKQAVATLSNAMDVGNPSNFIRILEIFKQNFPDLSSKLSSYTITDPETEETIKKLHVEHGYLSDPHGAVGYLALERYLNQHPDKKGFFLETAHPVKFPEAVERITGTAIPLPESISDIIKKDKSSIVMKADFNELKNYLLS